ncbi:MAG: ribose transport system permease protein [Moorella sp. (in: firmicutes)]|uniref:Ribose transport system permease protein RbsC n=1 Tax=Neomoorella thermoacetica TaxID=1525 RepID=A0A1J5P8D2_NEOTH|nr:ribose transport system permease protein [Moorella sp. (in: firmicutes)]OIQ61595.1 ribose transport system permease protein RbsC [Moorella thermoacetica]
MTKAKPPQNPLKKVGLGSQQLVILLSLVGLTALFSMLNPTFLSERSLDNIFRVSSIYGIAALGMTMVIITGGIDLSVSSLFALGGALGAGLLGIAYSAANPVKLPFFMAILIALGVTGFMGLINGLVITRLNLAPFVATLGMMTIARGITYVYTDFTVRGVPGSPITFMHPWFEWLGGGYIAGIPTQGVIFIVLAVLASLFLRYTAMGRNIYAVGGNIEIARLAGINTGLVIMLTYVISGILAGLSGIILTGRLLSASPLAANGYEMDVIAAVVIGGTSLSGGRGSIFGTVLGALIMSVLNNGLDMLNVPSFYQYLLKGIILVMAVISDQMYRQRTQQTSPV